MEIHFGKTIESIRHASKNVFVWVSTFLSWRLCSRSKSESLCNIFAVTSTIPLTYFHVRFSLFHWEGPIAKRFCRRFRGFSFKSGSAFPHLGFFNNALVASSSTPVSWIFPKRCKDFALLGILKTSGARKRDYARQLTCSDFNAFIAVSSCKISAPNLDSALGFFGK